MIETTRTENILRKVYFAFVILCLIALNYALITDSKTLLFATIGVQVVLIVFFTFKKYFLEIFILSLFFNKVFNWQFRVYVVLIVAFLIIFFYITYKNENIFNQLKLPLSVKITSAFLIIAIFLSGLLTPYSSFFTIYYSFIFFIFLVTGYVVFKSIKETDSIKKLLNIFIIGTLLAGITKIFAMINTGFLRAWQC